MRVELGRQHGCWLSVPHEKPLGPFVPRVLGLGYRIRSRVDDSLEDEWEDECEQQTDCEYQEAERDFTRAERLHRSGDPLVERLRRVVFGVLV